jgi:type I restriction enzyme, S subunit
MSSEILATPLEELCVEVIDCPHSTPVWMDKGVIVLRSSNIRNGRLDLSNPSYTDEHHYQERSKRATIRAGDLVITREAPMGEVCLIPENLKCCLGQRMVMLRPDQNRCHGKYLLYAIQSKRVQNQIQSHEGTGSTVSNLRIPSLKKLSIPSPDVETQKVIANILGTLDDKIELNRKTNETLEAMAKALFKSWFVDFDPVRAKAEGRPTGLPAEISNLFPDTFEDSELGEIPSGWSVQPLGNLCHKIGSGQTPRGGKDVYKGGAFALIRSQNIYNQGFSINGLVHIDDEQALQLSNVEVFPDDVLINITGDSVARSCPVPGSVLPARVNQHVSIIRTNKSVLVSSFVRFFLVEDFVQSNLLMLASGGATRNALTKGMLGLLRVVLPSMGAQTAFDSIAKLVLDKHSSNQNQNLLLSSLRDSLLPKLISGEIRIPDVEKMLEEVGV